MYKLSTYHLVVIYFLTYLPIYETPFLPNWLPRWNHTLTHLRFIHNWIITGIQWMVCWWVLVHCGPWYYSMLSPLWGSFACLVFGPRSLFLFLTCSWVLCFLKAWLGSIISTFVWVVTPFQFSRLIENESPLKTALQKSPCNRPQGPPSVWLLPSWSHYSVVSSVVWLSLFSYKNCCFSFFPTLERINLIL